MLALFTERRFQGFGPTAYDLAPLTLNGVSARKTPILRERLRALCPRRAGVYGMIDPRGRLVYVGKAKNLRGRLLSYFRPNSRDPKAGRILECARRIVWEEWNNEFAALLRELELIQRWRPSYNVQGQPGRRRTAYVVLSRPPAPHLSISRETPAKAVAAWGPILGAKRLTAAVRRLNDAFRLRDCQSAQPIHFADQSSLFPIVRPAGCLRVEIGACSGPCNEGTTRAGYARQVRAARGFLDGVDTSLLDRSEFEMRKAAREQEYERAAVLRDKLDLLRWLDGRLAWLRNARKAHSFVYPIDDRWYIIRRGQVQAVVAAPSNAASRTAAASAITAVFDRPESRGYAADQFDSVLLVTAWFRRHPEERPRLMTPEEAIAICGGVRVA
jgi:excinuclease ABC subunit C